MNTEEISFDPEDPRLTAYALDELPDPAERAAVEQILERSPEARATLHEIRALTAALRTEYEHERLLASGEGAAMPDNVIAMTPRGQAWPRRLLLAAALLLLTASVVRLTGPHHTTIPSNGQPAAKSADKPPSMQRFAFDEHLPDYLSPTPAVMTPAQPPAVAAQPLTTIPAFSSEMAAAKASVPHTRRSRPNPF